MKSKMNKIHNCDCLEFIKQVPNDYFDLVLTSPPYNLGNVHHTGGKRHKPYEDNMKEDKYQQWQISVINELIRIIKADGSILYNHKNRIRNGFQISPYEWINKTNAKIKQEIIWFNGSQNFDKNRFYPMTERIWWLSKQKQTKFYNRINHHDFFTKKEFGAEGTNKEHKRAFPLKMAEALIKNFGEDIKVFDPFMGSGTTAIAATSLGLEWCGCELEEDYCNIAQDRLKKVQGALL